MQREFFTFTASLVLASPAEAGITQLHHRQHFSSSTQAVTLRKTPLLPLHSSDTQNYTGSMLQKCCFCPRAAWGVREHTDTTEKSRLKHKKPLLAHGAPQLRDMATGQS